METSSHVFQVQPSGKLMNKDSFPSLQKSASDTIGDPWNEKKGANELSKKLKPNYIQVILNFQIFNLMDS